MSKKRMDWSKAKWKPKLSMIDEPETMGERWLRKNDPKHKDNIAAARAYKAIKKRKKNRK